MICNTWVRFATAKNTIIMLSYERIIRCVCCSDPKNDDVIGGIGEQRKSSSECPNKRSSPFPNGPWWSHGVDEGITPGYERSRKVLIRSGSPFAAKSSSSLGHPRPVLPISNLVFDEGGSSLVYVLGHSMRFIWCRRKDVI